MKGARGKGFRGISPTDAPAAAPSHPSIDGAGDASERLARQRANEQRFWRELGDLPGGQLIGQIIRFPARIFGCSLTVDPICAVANTWRQDPTMNWVDAAMTIGLSQEEADKIVRASWCDTGHDPILRSRLLTACRLRPKRVP